jgi:hypothetical protein
MFKHQWFFNGKIVKIIDEQTVVLWLDLGFEIGKKVLVRFNRIKAKGSYSPIINQGDAPEPSATTRFLEQNIKGKTGYFHIYKKTDFNNFDKYYAEVFIQPSDIPLRLKDVNKSLTDNHRLDGWVNLNDILVGQGMATYIQFAKDNQNAKIPVHNGSAWKHSEVRDDIGNCIETRNQSNSSWSGSSSQR